MNQPWLLRHWRAFAYCLALTRFSVLVLGAVAWLIRGALARLRTLERLTRLTARAGDHRVVESDGLIACCVGLLRPQVLVSRGLLAALLGDLDEAEQMLKDVTKWSAAGNVFGGVETPGA